MDTTEIPRDDASSMKRSAVLIVLFIGTWKVGAAPAASTVPVQGPMVGVDPPVVPSAAYGSPSVLSAVWNGKEFFAVWSDRRDPQQGNVFGAHVTGAGSVVDKTSLLITPGGNPAIAWDGTNYLLVYGETASTVDFTTDLVARRLGSDGKLLDSQRLALSTTVDSHYRVFWTGSEYAVFWDDRRPEYNPQTLMARLNRDGTVIATNLPVFPSGMVGWFSVDMPVGWSGSSFLLAKASATGPQVQLVSSQGQRVGTPRSGTGHRLQGGDKTSVTGVVLVDALEGAPFRGSEKRVRIGGRNAMRQHFAAVP